MSAFYCIRAEVEVTRLISFRFGRLVRILLRQRERPYCLTPHSSQPRVPGCVLLTDVCMQSEVLITKGVRFQVQKNMIP